MSSILFVTPVAEAGGSDHALLRMVRALPPDRFRVHVALPGPSPLEREFLDAGAVLHVVPMRRITTSGGPGWWLRYAAEWPLSVVRLVRLVRRHGVDLVATNSLHSWYGWAVAAVTRRPHVWHAREIVVQSRLALGAERRLIRGARAVIACSHAVARQFRDVVPADRLSVVHEDVDRAEFRPARAGRFRASVGIADDEPLVGFVGRVDTWKGIDVLLEAWPAVREARPDARLVVVGGPVAGKEAYDRDLQRRAAALGGTTWVGALPGAADVMADLDVFVAPSTSPEPYGLVLVEALASGARVVTTDAGGAPEIVARAVDGAGALVPPGAADDLASALVVLLEEPTSTERRLARPALVAPFPVDWASRYAAVLDAPTATR